MSSSRPTPIRPWWPGSAGSVPGSRSASASRASRATRPTAACAPRSTAAPSPFTCQGNLNGFAIEGGETLGYELADALGRRRPDASIGCVVQVGGGALASAVIEGLRRSARAGQRRTGRPRSASGPGGGPSRRWSRAYERLAHRLDADAPTDDDIAWAAGTGRRSCGRGSRSRTASPTGSSTTRPTTGWRSSAGCWRVGGCAGRRRRGDARGGERPRPGDDRDRRRPDRHAPAWPASSNSRRHGRVGPGRDRRRPLHRRPPRHARRTPRPCRRHRWRTRHEELPRSRHPVPQGLQPRRVLPGLRGRRRPAALRARPPQHATCSRTRPC